ncbi:hypothetical protein GGQ86_005319 [Xanthobacter flavus]|uniref:Uncharacterized protein n=1 Tax=Xanthobacter flavus TaxID=281 RepID=A0A9W6CTH0_XANFL|nr:hypothetical protein [Xanthobacter flavus]MBN8918745.1 hypothetical protein [Hyphomicrobiales bacterium]MDR6336815.1 hypothetical protein [Xanthobacter flavus]GLI25445.1 hypothetical protein XFLAVUS301_51190 [Xanthobacter flavus]
MSVIEHDFGAGKRRTEKRFRDLLNLDALHEQNVRANPLPYLERASERIYQLEKTIFEAALAARPAFGAEADDKGPAVTLSKAEYDRLLACRAIVDSALAEIQARPEEDKPR